MGGIGHEIEKDQYEHLRAGSVGNTLGKVNVDYSEQGTVAGWQEQTIADLMWQKPCAERLAVNTAGMGWQQLRVGRWGGNIARVDGMEQMADNIARADGVEQSDRCVGDRCMGGRCGGDGCVHVRCVCGRRVCGRQVWG